MILEQLRANGYVSRNWCLSQGVTRLGAYIADLKAEGYEFTANYDKGNYEYHLVKGKPVQVQDVKIENGKALITYHQEYLI